MVLGAASDAARASEAQKLLNYGFQAFDTVQLYPSGKPVSTLRVWKGAASDVAAGFVADQYLTLPKGKADKLALSMTATRAARGAGGQGPARGHRQGRARGQADGRTSRWSRSPTCPAANIFGRAWDTMRLWFK